MLVVQPTAARFEAADAGVSSNEHLLERISATENRITRLAERLERSLDLVLRQAQNSNTDRSLLKALIEVLAADGLINEARLERMWNEHCEKDQSNQNAAKRRSKKVKSVQRKSQLSKKRSPKVPRR